MTEAELGYAAGLIDGEGTIRIEVLRHARGKRRISRQAVLRVQVANTNPLMIVWLSGHFGGHMYIGKSGKAGWKRPLLWVILSTRARDFLQLVRPYLIVKAAQADLALAFSATMRARRGPPVLTATEWSAREAMVLQMSELNRKGVADA